MRNQPIPDSVQIIEDPTLPALSVMTFERDDGTYEHHMTIQREGERLLDTLPKKHARWYSSLITKTIESPKIEEFPPERVYLFEGYVYEFAGCQGGCLHRMEVHTDGILKCDAHPGKQVVRIIVQDIGGSVNGVLGNVVCGKCNAGWD